MTAGVTYSPEIAAKICAELLEDGARSLRTVCQLEGMPSRSTVYVWLAAYPEFAVMYAQACKGRADMVVDEIIEIADNAPATKGGVQKAKLKIDTRKWFAGVTNPKKYGDRVTQEHTGAGGGPITSRVTVEYVGVGDEDPDSTGV